MARELSLHSMSRQAILSGQQEEVLLEESWRLLLFLTRERTFRSAMCTPAAKPKHVYWHSFFTRLTLSRQGTANTSKLQVFAWGQKRKDPYMKCGLSISNATAP